MDNLNCYGPRKSQLLDFLIRFFFEFFRLCSKMPFQFSIFLSMERTYCGKDPCVSKKFNVFGTPAFNIWIFEFNPTNRLCEAPCMSDCTRILNTKNYRPLEMPKLCFFFRIFCLFCPSSLIWDFKFSSLIWDFKLNQKNELRGTPVLMRLSPIFLTKKLWISVNSNVWIFERFLNFDYSPKLPS